MNSQKCILPRRDFLAVALAAGIAVLFTTTASAEDATGPIKGATAVTKVFGDGQKLIAIALEYDQDIDSSRLSVAGFNVAGRTVTRVYANASAAPADTGVNGRYVIVELSPDDPGAALYAVQGRDVVRKDARATVSQTAPVFAVTGETYAANDDLIATRSVVNLIVDDFKQLEYTDPETGEILNYNLFVPRNYDPRKSYPLVLFMHDAGATSPIPQTTLIQGLGAVVWASPEDQAKREAFVLAPQYAEPVVNDRSEATTALDATVNLVNAVATEYSIDRNRLYATGQSGGCMMSIAMNIKYPDLFAASFLVAGQWDPAKVKPLAADRLWIVVSQGDLKAYPGQNAITAVLEEEGAKISRAVWSGRSTHAVFSANVLKMEAEGSPINYVALEKGTVVLAGQDDDGGSNHVNTWRIAYAIEGIREWLFKQHK